MKVNCAYCDKILERKPCRAKGNNYCNAKHQLSFEYARGIRDKATITRKANIKVRKCGFPERKGIPTWNKGLTKHTHPSLAKLAKDRIGSGNPMYNIRGKRNPRYNPNATRHRRKLEWNRSEYRQFRENSYKRDNYTCQVCNDNNGGNLNAHHKLFWKDYPELRFEVSNGITLCDKCHKELHSFISLLKNFPLSNPLLLPMYYLLDKMGVLA